MARVWIRLHRPTAHRHPHETSGRSEASCSDPSGAGHATETDLDCSIDLRLIEYEFRVFNRSIDQIYGKNQTDEKVFFLPILKSRVQNQNITKVHVFFWLLTLNRHLKVVHMKDFSCNHKKRVLKANIYID